jgi:hypothetical protein
LFTRDGTIVSDLPLGKSSGDVTETREAKVLAQMTAVGI